MRERRERPPAVPEARGETVRQAILRELEAGPRTARQLSELLHVRERDVIGHLEHLARSLRHGGRRLEVEPSRCLACGFRFEHRTRLTRPSACPRCREQHLTLPVFAVAGER